MLLAFSLGVMAADKAIQSTLKNTKGLLKGPLGPKRASFLGEIPVAKVHSEMP